MGDDLRDAGLWGDDLEDIFGIEDLFDVPDPDVPAVQPAPTLGEPADPVRRHIKPEISLALSDYEARMDRRRGRAATRITTPGNLMAPNIRRPELADTIG